MSDVPGDLLPVWHVRIEALSRYTTSPVLRASPALLDREHDRLTATGLRTDLEHLADLRVQAHIESTADGARWWGFDHGYAQPYFVDLARIEPMVKTLRRIATRLRTHQDRFGSLGGGDVVGYLAIVGAALGIEQYVIEGDRDGDRWMSGQRYRLVDAATLQSVLAARLQRLVLP